MHPKFKPNSPASEQAIHNLAKSLSRPLPSAYLKAMAMADGGEGFVGGRYIQLRRVNELPERNQRLKVSQYAPDFYLIGSDGGGEAYGVNGNS